jgi:hypothetical protein
MAEPQGITAELYRAIVTIVDDRVKEIRVTREDFDRLTQTVAQLAQAQARTEQPSRRVGASSSAHRAAPERS